LNRDGIAKLIENCSSYHRHLCPRQVLGVRIGLVGAAGLGLAVPRDDKRLLVIVESDGCFVDGISVATGCTVGHRTLRVEDYGKVAATFVDVVSEQAIRVTPCQDMRQRAWTYAPEESRRYFAQLQAYQVMPDEELLVVQEVRLTIPVSALVSRPGVRVNCTVCGEEIINEREIYINGMAVCRACGGNPYYIHPPQSVIFQIGFAYANNIPVTPDGRTIPPE